MDQRATSVGFFAPVPRLSFFVGARNARDLSSGSGLAGFAHRALVAPFAFVRASLVCRPFRSLTPGVCFATRSLLSSVLRGLSMLPPPPTLPVGPSPSRLSPLPPRSNWTSPSPPSRRLPFAAAAAKLPRAVRAPPISESRLFPRMRAALRGRICVAPMRSPSGFSPALSFPCPSSSLSSLTVSVFALSPPKRPVTRFFGPTHQPARVALRPVGARPPRPSLRFERPRTRARSCFHKRLFFFPRRAPRSPSLLPFFAFPPPLLAPPGPPHRRNEPPP